jgi:hypothetical protein
MKENIEPADLVKQFYQQNIDFKALEKALDNRNETAKNFSSYSLDPFTGEFGVSQKKHLLNRTVVGMAKRHLDDLNGLTLEQSINQIFTQDQLSQPRNNYYHVQTADEYKSMNGSDDVGPNEVFINRPYMRDNDEEFKWVRKISVSSVIYEGMYSQNTSIHWKLFTFLHNLVPTYPYDRNGHKGMYNYIKLLFDSCFTSYKDFIYNITINEAMLFYLNLDTSKKETPDENYAREVQELFTQGKRPFSEFSEEDVRGIARALVGWNYDNNFRYEEGHESRPVFRPWNHDTEDKQFSSYYNNRVIQGKSGEEGAGELQEVVDMLFETEKSALYIVRRLYQFFVYPVITEEIESLIIEPLAVVFRENDFSLIEPLRILLKSEHFFSSEIPNSIIKSPLDFQIGIMKEVELKSGHLCHHYNGERWIYENLEPSFFEEKGKDFSHREWMMAQRLHNDGEELGMRMLEPPNVSGWKPFYQAPVYDLFWINSSTASSRADISDGILRSGMWLNIELDTGTVHLRFNCREYLRSFENPENIESFLSQLIDRFIFVEVLETTKERLKYILNKGNSDMHWEEAVTNLFSETPEIESYHNTSKKIQQTIAALTIMAEFQLH